MSGAPSPHQQLAQVLAEQFSVFPQVQAIGLGGSQAGGVVDATSDIDLYVFTRAAIPLESRRAIVQARGATRADLDLNLWDPGDEWFDAPTGIEVDVMFWEPDWARAQVERVVLQHQAWMGYTTCHWHTMRTMQVLFDRAGWLAEVKHLADQPYPEELRRAIVSKNHAVLRNIIPAYLHQVEKAVQRGDLVSINHRVAALYASYFEVLFALNCQTHPGEKKLAALAQQMCTSLPEGMAEDVAAVLRSAGEPETGLLQHLNRLLDRLDELLIQQGFDPKTSHPMEKA